MESNLFINSESKKYFEYLKKCIEIPSDIAFSYVYGYCQIWDGSVVFDDSLYWIEFKYNKMFLPPIGDWLNADWNKIFEKIKPGTHFEFVPESLKDIWLNLFPNCFDVLIDEGTWDYMFDVRKLKELPDTERLNRKFHRENVAEIYKINSDNIDGILKFNNEAEYLIRKKEIDLSVLNDEDKAMYHILKHWNEFYNLEGIVIKINNSTCSYMIWEKLDDNSAVALFNKNIYKYKGINEACITEMCNCMLNEGINIVNFTCDAGILGLRKAKSERKPIKMLKKYTLIYKGKTNA